MNKLYYEEDLPFKIKEGKHVVDWIGSIGKEVRFEFTKRSSRTAISRIEIKGRIKMEIKDFKVGQRVWMRLVGNAIRGKREDELMEEWEIVSVGRKYVKAKKVGVPDYLAKNFEKLDRYEDCIVNKTKYSVDYIMYTNKQSILDEFEKEKLFDEIYDFFISRRKHKIGLEQLRKIYKIIFMENNRQKGEKMKFPDRVLDNTINIYKITIEACEDKETDYNHALDKVTISLLEELKEYRKAVKEELLVKILCKIGSDIYIIPSLVNFNLNVINNLEENNRVYCQQIEEVSINKNGWYIKCDKDIEYGTGRILLEKDFGETWFLTKEEAEQRQAEMRGEFNG